MGRNQDKSTGKVYKRYFIEVFPPVLILLVALLLRLFVFANSSHFQYDPDFNRDYLIASHIIKYGELPLKGPDGGNLTSSPFYYYVLAIPLFLYNSILTLGYFNLLLQIAFLVLAYKLARTMFGKTTALVALVFLSLGDSFIYQSDQLYRPNLMQTTIFLCFLFLYFAYAKNSLKHLTISIFLFFLAGSFYPGAMVMFPIFILPIYIISSYLKDRIRLYISVFLVSIVSLVGFYASTYFVNVPSEWHIIPTSARHISSFVNGDTVPGIIVKFFERTTVFLNFFLGQDNNPIRTVLFLCLFLFVILTYLFYVKRNENRKRNFLFLTGIVILFLMLMPWYPISSRVYFPSRYFSPIFGLTMILFSEAITAVLGVVLKKELFYTGAVIIIGVFLFSSQVPNIVRQSRNRMNSFGVDSLFHPSYIKDFPYKNIEDEVIRLKKINHYSYFDFFDFHTYVDSYIDMNKFQEDIWNNDSYWGSLEKNLNAHLVKVNDVPVRGYKPIGESDKRYIFLICRTKKKNDYRRDDCINAFFKNFPQYSFEKSIFSKLSTNDNPSEYIYLLKRKVISQ